MTFNPLQVTVMTYSQAKVQGKRSVGFRESGKTDGKTDEGNCITSLANAVSNKALIDSQKIEKHLFLLQQLFLYFTISYILIFFYKYIIAKTKELANMNNATLKAHVLYNGHWSYYINRETTNNIFNH